MDTLNALTLAKTERDLVRGLIIAALRTAAPESELQALLTADARATDALKTAVATHNASQEEQNG